MKFSPTQKALAWGVHAFTSFGIVTGFLSMIAIVGHRWVEATVWMLVSLVIDGVDGTFARLVKVTEVLPNMSGETIDDVIDFANYAIIPAFFLYQSAILPQDLNFVGASAILLVSALYYGKQGMVSSDYYFVGFPVMWNLVVAYLFFIVHLSPVGNFVAIIVFCILHFVPIKYVYPSRTRKWRGLTILMVVLCIGSGIGVLWTYPEDHRWLQIASLISVLYLATVGWFIGT